MIVRAHTLCLRKNGLVNHEIDEVTSGTSLQRSTSSTTVRISNLKCEQTCSLRLKPTWIYLPQQNKVSLALLLYILIIDPDKLVAH